MPLVCCWTLGCRALAAAEATATVLGLVVARVMACDMERTGCCRPDERSTMLLVLEAAAAALHAEEEWPPSESARMDERSDDVAILDDRDIEGPHMVCVCGMSPVVWP